MIITACTCLTVLHPAICFQGTWHEANFTFRSKKDAGYASGSTGDEESQTEIKMNPVQASS